MTDKITIFLVCKLLIYPVFDATILIKNTNVRDEKINWIFEISVRSLASVALRKSLNSRPGFHFDYFTIDLNEEFSGLNGALLYDQVQYVNHSVYRVLELYKKLTNPPSSIILIGHSMVSLELKLAYVPETFYKWNLWLIYLYLKIYQYEQEKVMVYK